MRLTLCYLGYLVAGGFVGPRVESSWTQAGVGDTMAEERACLDQRSRKGRGGRPRGRVSGLLTDLVWSPKSKKNKV